MAWDLTTVALIVSVFGGIPGFLVLWFYSKPEHKALPERLNQYFDYNMGAYIREQYIEVTLGKLKGLKHYSFRKLTLLSLDFPDMRPSLEMADRPMPSPLIPGRDWFENSKKRHSTVFLKRIGCPVSEDAFIVKVVTMQEKSKSQIRELVKKEISSVEAPGKTAVTIKFTNTASSPIKDFEIYETIPFVATFSIIGVWKVNVHKQLQAVQPNDFSLRDEVIMQTLTTAAPHQHSTHALVGSVTLDPGLTEVKYEFS
jgi:hypothetical protein